MAVPLALARGIDALNAFVGRAVSWLLLLTVLISAINATTRKLFSLSSNAWLESQWYLFSAVFLLAAGYTLLDNEHVKVDILYKKLSRTAQLWIEIAGIIVCLLPFCAITIYLTWPIVMAKFAAGEVSNNTGGLILWPVWALIPAGFALLAAQAISEFIKRVAALCGAAPDLAGSADSAPTEH